MFRAGLASTPSIRWDARLCGTFAADGGKHVQQDEKRTVSLTPQEALIYTMVAVAASDRAISEKELARINSMVIQLPVFRDIDSAWLSREAQDCGRILARPGGMEKVVRLIVDALPVPLRETAYALAAEVAASDLTIKAGERDFLSLLAEGLQLDELVRAALERAAAVRHRQI